MNDGLVKFEGFFKKQGHLRCAIGGLALALAFAGIAAGTSGGVTGVFVLFMLPFMLWMILSCLLVLFSERARGMLVGEGYTAIGGFFGRLVSPFGLFYYGMRFGFIAFGAMFGIFSTQ